MATHAHLLLQFPNSFTSSSLNPNIVKLSNNIIRCYSTRSRSNLDSNAEPTSTGRSFRFNPDKNNFYTDGDDFGDADDFSTKKRSWWSDYDNDDDWEFDEEEDEFWIFKIFRAFGWMLPAIAISVLLGTGPNAFMMALAVPLGQSVVSLALEKVWGTTDNSRKSRSRTKTKRKPYTKAASSTKTRQGKQGNEAGKGRESYQSWVGPDDGGAYNKKSDNKSNPRFGGWDQLDKKVGNQKIPKRTPTQMKNEMPKRQKQGKFSKIGRIREKPLLLRLLIAVFPFLGSWTKLLF